MPARVLVVEDDELNRMVARRMLERREVAVDLAAGGAEALARLAEQSYGLVLMDCEMPGLDGLETTRRLRRAEAGGRRRVPVVAMTGHVLPGDRERCLDAGMDDHLAKPLRWEALGAVLERWLRSEDAGPETGPAAAPDGRPLVDHARLEQLRAVRDDLPEQLVALFRAEMPGLLEGLRGAAERGDHAEVAFLVHKLKGSSRNVGAVRLAEACEAVEQGPAGDEAALERLVATYRATGDALARG